MKAVYSALAALALVAGNAVAQQYPSKPVRVIIPWPPGQATDLAARIVGDKLSQAFGQPFVMENKPGAGGAIGTMDVVRAAPDGYTLLAASSGPLSIMPNLQKTPFETLKDLAPISLTAAAPFALVSAQSFAPANAKDLVALVRANPDKYAYSSSGTGATAHMFSELFHSMAQLKARHIPYKGSAPGLVDVMNGQVNYTIDTVAAVVGHVKSGRLKGYGVTTAKRSSALPELPPLAEAAGIPGYDVSAWIGYAAPAGTPREVLVRISTEIQKAMQAQDLKDRYTPLGLEPAASRSPDEMVAFMRSENDRYASIIRTANIKIEQ